MLAVPLYCPFPAEAADEPDELQGWVQCAAMLHCRCLSQVDVLTGCCMCAGLLCLEETVSQQAIV